MAQTTTNLKLTVWNNLTDPYDSSQLVDNFVKIDLHDHSTDKGVQIDTGGIKDSAITTAKIADGAIVNADINASAAIVDTKLSTIATAGKVSNSALAGSGAITVGSTSIALGATATTVTGLTLTSPVLTSPSFSTIVNTGTITLPTSTDTLVGKATTDTLTNKSLSDSTTFIVDSTDNTKKVNIDVTGTTGITGTLQTTFTTAKTIAFPDTAGTVVTTGDSATVSSTMLTTTGVTAGTYSNVTVDTKGRVSTGTTIGYGSILPGTPADGDEYYYVTNGSVWHLRYTTLAGLNKWQFVGGTALTSVVTTTGTFNTATYAYTAASGSSGPSITVPITGTYKIEFGMDVSNSNANRVNYMALSTSTTANTGLITGAEIIVPNADANVNYNGNKIIFNFSLTATSVIYAQFKASVNTATVLNRYISITPITLG